MALSLSGLYERWGERPEWMARGACQGKPPALFFRDEEEDAGPAKEICSTCGVKAECLSYALIQSKDATDAGIWGGTTPKERRAMRRRVRRARAQLIQDEPPGGS